MAFWDIMKDIGEGVVDLLPGGKLALGAIKGVKAIANAVGGETGGKIAQGVAMVEEGLAEVQPENMPPEIKAEVLRERNRHEEAMREAEREDKRLDIAADQAAADQVTDRAAKLEGTAEDLLKLPVIGRIVLFLRGCQRPVWGFSALVMDWQLLSGSWTVELYNATADAITAEGWIVLAINVLVLGFLFGERAIKNLLPLVAKVLEAWGMRGTKEAAQ